MRCIEKFVGEKATGNPPVLSDGETTDHEAGVQCETSSASTVAVRWQCWMTGDREADCKRTLHRRGSVSITER